MLVSRRFGERVDLEARVAGRRSGRGALRWTAGLVATLALALGVAGTATSAPTPVLGPSALTAEQISDWYESLGIRSRSPTPVPDLAAMFVDEGTLHGVRRRSRVRPVDGRDRLPAFRWPGAALGPQLLGPRRM